MAPESFDKKSSKRARTLTSGGLRKAAEEKAAKAAKKTASAKKVPERLVTAEVWARGNRNPLVQAFLSEHARQRTVKRTGSAWIDLFRNWKEQPRG